MTKSQKPTKIKNCPPKKILEWFGNKKIVNLSFFKTVLWLFTANWIFQNIFAFELTLRWSDTPWCIFGQHCSNVKITHWHYCHPRGVKRELFRRSRLVNALYSSLQYCSVDYQTEHDTPTPAPPPSPTTIMQNGILAPWSHKSKKYLSQNTTVTAAARKNALNYTVG